MFQLIMAWLEVALVPDESRYWHKIASEKSTKTRLVNGCVPGFLIRLFVSGSTDTGRHISVIYKTLRIDFVSDEPLLSRSH